MKVKRQRTVIVDIASMENTASLECEDFPDKAAYTFEEEHTMRSLCDKRSKCHTIFMTEFTTQARGCVIC